MKYNKVDDLLYNLNEIEFFFFKKSEVYRYNDKLTEEENIEKAIDAAIKKTNNIIRKIEAKKGAK